MGSDGRIIEFAAAYGTAGPRRRMPWAPRLAAGAELGGSRDADPLRISVMENEREGKKDGK